MKQVLLSALTALSVMAQSSSPPKILVGPNAPSASTCQVLTVGDIYVRSEDPANAPINVLRCTQTGALTFAWQPVSHVVVTTLPATCAVGDIAFKSDASAGANLYGCAPANTWTAQAGGGGGSGDVVGPATNSADFIPQWNGANSKTLKNGIAVAQTATASTIAQRNSSGEVIAANTVATGKTPMATDTPIAAAQLANASLGPGAASISRPATAGVGGVTAKYLAAKDTTDPTRRVLPASGGCGGGIAATPATVGNTFEMYVVPGTVITGVADNAVTAGHILVGGTTTPGRVRDSGQTSRMAIASNVCIVGAALAGASSGADVLFEYDGPGTFGSGTPVIPNTGDATISSANLYRTIHTNTGASAQVNLTLGAAACTVGQTFSTYITAAFAIKLIPFTGDQIMTLTSAVNHSITSDAVVGSFVSLSCLATGKWYLTGLNGAWTDTN